MPEWEISEAESLLFEEPVHQAQVSVVAGDITISAVDGPAALEVRQVSGPPITVSLRDGRLEVRHDREYHGWRGAIDRRSASLVLSLPPTCSSQLQSVSASVLVGAMAGDLELESVSGDVTLESLAGQVKARSVSGGVTGRGLAGAFGGETVSGEIILEAFSGPEIKLDSVSGDLTADLQESEPACSTTIDTVSGAVYLRLPAQASQQVRVESVSGSLNSAFPELTAHKQFGSRTLKGTLGEGGGHLDVNTVSGDVSLLAEDQA